MKRISVVMNFEDVTIRFESELAVVSRLVSAIERELGVCRNFQLSIIRSNEVENE